MRGNDMKQSSSRQRRSLFVRVAAVVIALCMIAALALPALASETGYTYTYTVRIFAGKQGTIDGKDVKEYSVTPGQKLNVDWNELKKLIKVTDSRYEATGFRLRAASLCSLPSHCGSSLWVFRMVLSACPRS